MIIIHLKENSEFLIKRDMLIISEIANFFKIVPNFQRVNYRALIISYSMLKYVYMYRCNNKTSMDEILKIILEKD